jgi:hypothetical protein
VGHAINMVHMLLHLFLWPTNSFCFSMKNCIMCLCCAFWLSFCWCATLQTDVKGIITCVVAAQVANICESIVGATLQGQKGFKWVKVPIFLFHCICFEIAAETQDADSFVEWDCLKFFRIMGLPEILSV